MCNLSRTHSVKTLNYEVRALTYIETQVLMTRDIPAHVPDRSANSMTTFWLHVYISSLTLNCHTRAPGGVMHRHSPRVRRPTPRRTLYEAYTARWAARSSGEQVSKPDNCAIQLLLFPCTDKRQEAPRRQVLVVKRCQMTWSQYLVTSILNVLFAGWR